MHRQIVRLRDGSEVVVESARRLPAGAVRELRRMGTVARMDVVCYRPAVAALSVWGGSPVRRAR
jgi:hypothetical protein